MDLKQLFDKGIDFIDSKRKSIIKFSLSIIGLILLMILLFLSSDELTIGKESEDLLNYIDNTQYQRAISYYDSLEKKFSESKMRKIFSFN